MMKHYIIPANVYHKLKSQQQLNHVQSAPSIVVPHAVPSREEEEEEGGGGQEDKFVLDAFPKSTKGRATRLLTYIEKHEPKITWSRKNGIVSVDGRLIPDSNIIDLIRSAISGSKRPVGWQEFSGALKSINTPVSLISPSLPPGIPETMKLNWLTR
jgi:hypothetical protein